MAQAEGKGIRETSEITVNPERQKGIAVVGTGWGFGDFPLCKGSTAQHKGVSWYNSFGIILTEMD